MHFFAVACSGNVAGVYNPQPVSVSGRGRKVLLLDVPPPLHMLSLYSTVEQCVTQSEMTHTSGGVYMYMYMYYTKLCPTCIHVHVHVHVPGLHVHTCTCTCRFSTNQGIAKQAIKHWIVNVHVHVHCTCICTFSPKITILGFESCCMTFSFCCLYGLKCHLHVQYMYCMHVYPSTQLYTLYST